MQTASTLKRMLNLIIDFILIIGICILLFYTFSILYIKLSLYKYISEGKIIRIDLLIVLVMFFYYLIFESLTGKTAGKYLTRTKVIDKIGNKPNFLFFLLRTIIRIIPLDFFSYIFSSEGWHDKYSSTQTIDEAR